MSFSKESQEYHLTPKGWVLGSFKGDALGGSEERPIPKDRVLTIICVDELSSPYSSPKYYDRIIWKSDNQELVSETKRKWGNKPDWFGYKKQ